MSVTSSSEQPTDTMTSTESETTNSSSDSEIATYGESLEFSEEEPTPSNYEEFNNLTINELSFEENDGMSTNDTINQLTSVENATTLTELLMDETVNSLSIIGSSQCTTKSMELSVISTEKLLLSSSSENPISSFSTLTTTHRVRLERQTPLVGQSS